MAGRLGKLTLRDFFWLMLLAAVGIGWYLEWQRAAQQISKYAAKTVPYTPPTFPSADAQQRELLLVKYRALSNEQLNQEFAKLEPASPFHASSEYSCCLTEMARRRMQAELQVHYDRLMKVGKTDFGGPANALLLTALRRAQGKHDPVEVLIGLDKQQTIVDDAPQIAPRVIVDLKNVDAEPIALTRGGDYRSGRQSRWRVELFDEWGKRLPDSNFPPWGTGGGISSFGFVKPGESVYRYDENTLDARSYVKLPPSGRYQLQVVYAEQEIASEPELSGLAVWRSRKLPVIVENFTAQHAERVTSIPLFAILCIAGLIAMLAAIRSRRIVDATRIVQRGGLNLRDFIALSLLIILAGLWTLSSRQWSATIERLRPDRDTEWLMKPADSKT